MPLWEFECEDGHRADRLRSIATRDDPIVCSCGKPARRVEISAAHVPPDGVYSYAPNIGDPERFERQRAAMREGKKVIPRERSKRDLERDHDPPRPRGTFFSQRNA